MVDTVVKQLIGLEDLLIGEGSVNQTRNGVSYPITKTSVMLHVADVAAARLITPALAKTIYIKESGLFDSAITVTPGTYVDNGTTIIVPTGEDGSIAWVKDTIVSANDSPIWLSIPTQNWTVGDEISFDLNPYVRSPDDSAITIAEVGDNLPKDLTLVAGVVTGTIATLQGW